MHDTWIVFIKQGSLKPILSTISFPTLDTFLTNQSFVESSTIPYVMIREYVPSFVEELYEQPAPTNLAVVVGYTSTETSVYTLYILKVTLKVKLELDKTDSLLPYIPIKTQSRDALSTSYQNNEMLFLYLLIPFGLIILFSILMSPRDNNFNQEVYIKSNSLGCSQFQYRGDLFWRCPQGVQAESITTVITPPRRSSYEEDHPVIKD